MNPTASSARAKPPAPAHASSEPVSQALPPLTVMSEPFNALADGSLVDGKLAEPRAPILTSSSAIPLSEVLAADARAVVVAIPASPEFVRVVRLAVAGVATRMRFSYEQVEDIKLAVSEACNNAILHAEPSGGGAPTQVVVRLRPLGDRLEITVFDQGHMPRGGLDLPIAGAHDRAGGANGGWSDLDDLPEGGMGLMLIQSLMDEVSSHTGAPDHTALHMVKLTRSS